MAERLAGESGFTGNGLPPAGLRAGLASALAGAVQRRES